MTQPILPSSASPLTYRHGNHVQPLTRQAFSLVADRQPAASPLARVLLIEPMRATRDVLCMALERAGYEVISASNGAQGLQLFDQAATIDLVLVAAVMPGIDGYTVCAELRKYSYVPIVLLSDLNQIDQVVQAFSIGADDYMIKPFHFPILEARLQALLRRVLTTMQPAKPRILAIDDIVLNADLHEVSVSNQMVNLSPIEYGLLHYLMHMVDRPVSKQELFRNVWGYEDMADVNLVRVGVHRLREKIEKNPTQPRHVLTVPGYGYKFHQVGSTN